MAEIVKSDGSTISLFTKEYMLKGKCYLVLFYCLAQICFEVCIFKAKNKPYFVVAPVKENQREL